MNLGQSNKSKFQGYQSGLISSRLFEYLAATTEMATTKVPGEDSFTSALIYALEALVEEKVRFTTVELLGKIRNHAPNFPRNQTPVLSDRKDEVQAGRIMLHPLHRTEEDGSQDSLLSEETTKLNALKRRTVTLHLDFGDQPSHTDIEMLGHQLNQIFERYTLNVNRVRWGGMKQSAAARAVGSFQAGLKRYRRASMKQQQVASDDIGASELWRAEKNSELLTPASSSQHSPRTLEFSATEKARAGPPEVSVTSFLNALSSNEESDEGKIPDRKVRNKKQKSAMEVREAS